MKYEITLTEGSSIQDLIKGKESLVIKCVALPAVKKELEYFPCRGCKGLCTADWHGMCSSCRNRTGND